jgi:hypothetical protein
VTADPKPNDVRVAGPERRTGAEERAAVVGPGHFPHIGPSLESLDAKSLSEDSPPKVLDELVNRDHERFTLFARSRWKSFLKGS